MRYVWEKTFTITAQKITGQITISGIPEVGYPQEIGVIISNARTEDSNGTVTVEILKDSTIVDTLESALETTVPKTSQWSKNYVWTPKEQGNYKVRATYEEATNL